MAKKNKHYKVQLSFHSELDLLYEYFEKYYVDALVSRNKNLYSFDYYKNNRTQVLNNKYCQFLQLQSWNSNRYFIHFGGLGCKSLPNVLMYRTFNMHGNIKYNFSDWIVVKTLKILL